MNQIRDNISSDSIDDGEYPLTTPFTTLLSTGTILDFLDKNIPDDTALIVSTVRKGSWIIEDYIRRRGRRLCNITSNEPFPTEYDGGKIVLFDDSIHTGETIDELYRKISNTEQGHILPERDTTVCCIAINEGALSRLNTTGIYDVRYLRMFKTYEDYIVTNGKERELAPDCQSFYYSHFIIPYISGLSFNYSPDYRSLSITLKDDTSADLRDIADTVLCALDGYSIGAYDLYQDTRIIRRSAELEPGFTSEVLKEFCSAPFETDMGKIRISVISWDGKTEIVITPIVSYVIRTDDDLSDLLVRCSEKIIKRIKSDIMLGLENKRYNVLEVCEFQADKATRWRQ